MDLSQPPPLSFQPFKRGDFEPAASTTIIIEDSVFLRSPNTVSHVEKNYLKVLNRGQRTAPCAWVLPSSVSVEE